MVTFRDGKTRAIPGHSLTTDSSSIAFLIKDEDGEVLVLLAATAVTSIEWREGLLKHRGDTVRA